MFSRTLDAPPSKVRFDIFPHSPKGNHSNGRELLPPRISKRIEFILKEEGSQNILQMKNPLRTRVRAETRTCGTDSPSRSKSRELSITPLHHPQKKDGSMTDFKHPQSDPHGRHRKMFSRTLDAPPSKVCSDIFPHSPKGNQSNG